MKGEDASGWSTLVPNPGESGELQQETQNSSLVLEISSSDLWSSSCHSSSINVDFAHISVIS